MGRGLRENTGLRELYLDHNNIVDMREIAIALKANRTLRKLGLQCNKIKDVNDLCEGLRQNQILTWLWLEENQIDWPDKASLREAARDYLDLFL